LGRKAAAVPASAAVSVSGQFQFQKQRQHRASFKTERRYSFQNSAETAMAAGTAAELLCPLPPKVFFSSKAYAPVSEQNPSQRNHLPLANPLHP
jgi:hypothetical protein